MTKPKRYLKLKGRPTQIPGVDHRDVVELRPSEAALPAGLAEGSQVFEVEASAAGEMVLVPASEIERWQVTAHLLSRPAAAQELAASLQELEAGGGRLNIRGSAQAG